MTDRRLPWLRLYTEIIDDEKIRLLAFEDRWHYTAILCCKGQGILDESNQMLMRRKVAVKLGLQVRELEEVARRLGEVGLIDEDTLQPCGWCKRQFASDNSSERVRRHRARAKTQGDDKSDVTLHGTLQQRSSNALDTDTDTDIEDSYESSSSAVADRLPACPHRDIIDLYLETLPELPAVVASRWSGSQAAKWLKTRWREDPRHRDLEFWRRFFQAVRTNPHWMGENGTGWQADLGWLVKRSSFDKVITRMVNAREAA